MDTASDTSVSYRRGNFEPVKVSKGLQTNTGIREHPPKRRECPWSFPPYTGNMLQDANERLWFHNPLRTVNHFQVVLTSPAGRLADLSEPRMNILPIPIPWRWDLMN
jgi:hypothetical protein